VASHLHVTVLAINNVILINIIMTMMIDRVVQSVQLVHFLPLFVFQTWNQKPLSSHPDHPKNIKIDSRIEMAGLL
jgi:hypothetical protein